MGAAHLINSVPNLNINSRSFNKDFQNFCMARKKSLLRGLSLHSLKKLGKKLILKQ
jgi:hypothetical protein